MGAVPGTTGIRRRQTGLRQFGSVGNVNSGLDDGDNLRPGQADILARADHQTAAGAGQVTGFQQTAQIVPQRRVGVGAATSGRPRRCRWSSPSLSYRMAVRTATCCTMSSVIVRLPVFYGCLGDGKFRLLGARAYRRPHSGPGIPAHRQGEHGGLVSAKSLQRRCTSPVRMSSVVRVELKYRAAGQKARYT